MTLSVGQSIAIIAVCAACTFFERWLPWLLFGRRAVPKVVVYLGRILPMAVMVSMTLMLLAVVMPCMAVRPVRPGAHGADHHHSHRQPGDLLHGLASGQLALQLRDQICQRHIDEAARCNG